MAPAMTYRQCELTQAIAGGHRRHVAWLPSDDVRIGRIIRIDDIDGTWRIDSAGTPRDAEIVLAYEANGRRGFPSVSGHDREHA